MKRTISIAVCAFTLATLAFAQADLLGKANQAYQAGDLQAARSLVDQAIKEPGLASAPETWVLRGFIYKDLYREAPSERSGLLRDEALASLYNGIRADSTRQYAESSTPAYLYLASTIYNDAVRSLNELEPEAAIRFHAKYAETLRRLVPDTVLTDRNVEFNNALGTVYIKLFGEDRLNLALYDNAVAAYKRALDVDSANYGANYNLATLYYNRGVYNIQRISADNDIPSIQQIQEVSREFFTLALPYMLKAHHMNPGRAETILGLEGIHYSLQDEEQSKRYRHLYEELEHDERPEKDQ